jgi:hypothetical protein
VWTGTKPRLLAGDFEHALSANPRTNNTVKVFILFACERPASLARRQ